VEIRLSDRVAPDHAFCQPCRILSSLIEEPCSPETRKVIEDGLFDLIDSLLRSLGSTLETGEEFRHPPLDVLRYYRRPVRWSGIPILGRAMSVVAVVRQPLDTGLSDTAYTQFLLRLAAAASGRFPPWNGMVIGLTGLVLTPEPIGPGDDAVLGRVLGTTLRRFRVVPFGLIRVNIGQEAIAFALKASPDRLFPEPERLADALSEHLRRFVPLAEM
jgi:hypothetical protein